MKDKFIPHGSLTTPVLFMIFNRPDTTQKVFNAIRQAKPKQLFIAADGPREGTEGEKEKCEQVRKIMEQVDWDCEVKTLFSDKNLGCKIAVTSAIDWFFEKVEEGIILEDDCLPTQSFFWFCQELLKYYRNDTRIMMISGDNFLSCQKKSEGSYYFSKYALLWGWATWRRAWRYYDIDMKTYEKFKSERQIKNIFRTKQQQKFWTVVFQVAYDGGIDTWDYHWVYACLINNGLCIMPNVNLISNIGFGIDSTHTPDENSFFSKMKTKDITEIVHPKFVLVDQEVDLLTSKLSFGNINILIRAKNKALIILKSIGIFE